MAEKRDFGVTAAVLHLLAMGLMLCDHMWAMLFPGAEWLTCVGRLAFPIFAFLAAEGYFHTRDLRRYLLRLLVWALIAEIPFDLMYGGSIFYPFHQNVLWTLLISLVLVHLMEQVRKRLHPLPAAALCLGLAGLGYLLGYAAMVDYYGVGILTVLVFYVFRERNWISLLGQVLCLYGLNVVLLGGYQYEFTLFGREFALVQQGLALLALIPIWLYQGRQGFHNREFQVFCYAFYPAHMLILFLIWNQIAF